MEQALAGVEMLIGYQPLEGEPNYRHAPILEKYLTHIVLLPHDRKEDPFALAESVSKMLTGKQVAVLIPGTRFDAVGTRHGRGGGWYDRFLARVPRAWLRIGVTHTSQVSSMPLEREPWDEPMDWLLIQDGDGWSCMKAETV